MNRDTFSDRFVRELLKRNLFLPRDSGTRRYEGLVAPSVRFESTGSKGLSLEDDAVTARVVHSLFQQSGPSNRSTSSNEVMYVELPSLNDSVEALREEYPKVRKPNPRGTGVNALFEEHSGWRTLLRIGKRTRTLLNRAWSGALGIWASLAKKEGLGQRLLRDALGGGSRFLSRYSRPI